MNKSKMIACIFASLLIGGGCVDSEKSSDEEKLLHSMTADGLSTVMESLWGRASTGSTWNGNISTCWKTSGYSTQKQWIQAAVEDTWGHADESHINFTGWSTCTSSGADVEIYIRAAGDTGVSQVLPAFGSGLDGVYIQVRNDSGGFLSEHDVRRTTIHEFGHVLSFAHEQNRDDTPSTCTDPPNSQDPTYDLTIWDINSTMNYCNPNYFNYTAPLNAWDSDGLRRAYGFPNKFTKTAGWCTNGGKVYKGDFNGDGLDDLLCFNSGDRWIDYSYNGQFNGTNFSNTTDWCTGSSTLHIGDFDGDGKDDMMCKSSDSRYWIDYASDGFYGTDYYKSASWCTGSSSIHIGDFNGDGRDDLLCHSTAGSMWIDYASTTGQFNGTDYTKSTGWCTGSGQLYIGNFNHDTRADLLCHSAGKMWIDYSYYGQFNGTDWSYSYHIKGSSFRFCSNEDLYIGDVNGDGKDDMVCHDNLSGRLSVQFNTYHKYVKYGVNGTWYYYEPFGDESWHGPLNYFCGEYTYTEDFILGKFNNDDRTDFLCHTRNLGYMAIEYPTSFNRIAPTSNSTGYIPQSNPL